MEVVIIETTSNTPTVQTFYGGPDIPADEMALSIDHIRKHLFMLLTPEDRFNCRRLNRVWNSYATVELQERFELKCAIKEENLEAYLDLLQKHQEIFPFLPLPIFRKYSFKKVTLDILSDQMLQQFLRTYGYFIRDLSLNQKKFFYSKDTLPKEKDVMEYIRSLLIHSAPNLSSLRMCGINLKVDWQKNSLDRDQDSRRTLRTTDPEFEEIHLIPDSEKNENLKFFSFTSISGKIFELVVQLAPNLEEVQVRSPYRGDHKYFIEPLNRLRLCKAIEYYCRYSSGLFKKYVDSAREGLKLRQFSFMFGREDNISNGPSVYPEFFYTCHGADVYEVNKILASSWDSLETITWRWVMAYPRLKWPGVMPNVSRIKLGPFHRPLQGGLHAFPPGFSFSKTFPKLRELHFCEGIETSGFQQAFQCFGNQCIDSVKEVHLLAENSEERDATTLANFEQLRRLFPSAQVLSARPYNRHGLQYSTDSDGGLFP